MNMRLNDIRDNPGAKTVAKRVGRGVGSGLGKTCGAGQKGQKSRTGVSLNGFEGGQMPIYRRLPKRGFNSPYAGVRTGVVNLGDLQKLVDDKKIGKSDVLNFAKFLELGVIGKASDCVKLLAKGQLKAAVKVEVHGASQTAKDAVAKAGGEVIIVE